MDEEAAILAAIAADPAEDTPRLAYADWLDDHAADRPDPPAARVRAEFIRVQCEIKRYEHLSSSELQGYVELYRRQDVLLTRHRRDLLGPLGDALTERDVVFDRGFPVEVRLDAPAFLKAAAAVAALRPLPRVHVGNAGPVLNELVDLPDLGVVTTLTVSGSEYDPFDLGDGGAALLAACPHFRRLEVLELEGCRVGDLGLDELASSPALRGVVGLDLSGNEISDTGVVALVASPLWPRLKYLVLGANPISDEGAFALADAGPTAIAYLNVKFTGIGRAGQQRLLHRKGWKVDLF